MEVNFISTLRARKAEQEAEIKRCEDALVTKLKALIPQSLKAWIEEDMADVTIDALIKDGKRSDTYGANQYNTYNFASLKEFAERFKELKIAWQDVVNIDINWEGPNFFEITFTAN